MRLVASFFLLLCAMYGFDDFSYTLDVDKHTAVVKEGVSLKLHIRQNNTKDVLSFDFVIPPSAMYQVKLLDTQESKDAKGRVAIHASYLLYPLKAGDITIIPHLIVKKASKEELKKFVTGSADELMYLRTRNKDIRLDRIEIAVKKLDKQVDLIGEYTLDFTIDKQEIDVAEQVNLIYTLSGNGYKPLLASLLDSNISADIFLDKSSFDKRTFHKDIFSYALKSKEDFVIPAIALLAYSPQKKSYYTLYHAPLAIKVHPSAHEHSAIMIGEENRIDWLKYLDYLLLFIAGFAVQKLLVHVSFRALNKREAFVNQVKMSKNPKDLLKFLLSEDVKMFKSEIKVLEGMLYHDRKVSLAEIKKAILLRLVQKERDDSILS